MIQHESHFLTTSALTIVYTNFKSVDLHFENMVAGGATRRRTFCTALVRAELPS